jgi:uncharacterized protein
MKYLLVLLVVVLAAWLLLGRRGGGGGDGLKDDATGRQRVRPAQPPAIDAVTMIACAHCGVHLPAADVLYDAAGRPFCSEAHRAAGPR